MTSRYEAIADEVVRIVSDYVDFDDDNERLEFRWRVVKAVRPPTLEDFDLMEGQKVKFRRSGRKTLAHGAVHGVNDDGSLLIIDHTTGAARSIVPANVLARRTGPKGGTIYKEIVT
jgi:hypothetical protein